ncbi:GDSL esterase/lipase 7-like [Ananas comosus]|uniref:GDSL esterase/lipase 7-like n=1 Tax=Ananas comosus TaxID=4615 RepID=A0A6P5EXT1_ANACO|nr:GDSL esterase/lipase 7-like [Ananas comosus]
MAPSSSLPPLFSLLFLFLFLSPLPSLSLPQPHPGSASHLLIDAAFSAAPPPPPPPFPSPAAAASPLAPALFVLGDSTVDCGTNNFLGTLARADRAPYGRDFDTHRPTGRFSNGRIIVDYLALRLGLPFVPPYLGQSGKVEDMIYGVNYASAAAGILFASGSDLGMHVSLTQQIQQVTDTSEQLALSLGEEAAADLFRRSVFYVSIGSNDFIHYYLRNTSSVQSLYLPWEFNQLLVNTVKQELKNLYNTNVRKFIVMGLAPIGCTPHYLWQYGSINGECINEINNLVVEFNYAMRYMVQQLSSELPDAMVTFCDAFEGSMDILKNRDRYGFQTTTDACCGLGKYGGLIMCLVPEMACSNASNHVWWDEFHPTDAVNRIIADNVWSGEHATMCYPMNLQEMTKPKL